MTPTNPSRNDRIVNAAQIYQQNLCDQTVLFVYGKPSSPQTVEVEFKAGNFCHLVGVEPRRDGLMRMKASELYSRAIEGALHSGNYGFSRGQDYCDLKLEVIGRIVRIDTNARMIGDFEDGRFVNLSTDKVVGRQNAVLGLVETGDVFVPNSVINADIREIARSASQVLATFKDPTLNSVKCSTVRYVAESLEPSHFKELCKVLQQRGELGEALNYGSQALESRLSTAKTENLLKPVSASPGNDARIIRAVPKPRRGPTVPPPNTIR